MVYGERSPLLGPKRIGARRRSVSSSSKAEQGQRSPHHAHQSILIRGSSGGREDDSPALVDDEVDRDDDDEEEEDYEHLTEDDIAIEGMVLVLLNELELRGYVIPRGLVDKPLDMPVEEVEAEQSLFRTVFNVPRHKGVLDRYLPVLNRSATGLNEVIAVGDGPSKEGAGPQSTSTTNNDELHLTASSSASNSSTTSTTTPIDPVTDTSSLTKAEDVTSVVDESKGKHVSTATTTQMNGGEDDVDPSELPYSASDIITSPSALLLCALLSLLISLQEEVTALVQETDRGVDGELRMFKARRELGERLYAIVGGLLDSYLLTGDAHPARSNVDDDDEEEEEPEDALVTLLFHDFPLNYDSTDRATCALDLLLNLTSYPLVEAEDLVSHPVILASTEYVWRNGLLPPPRRGVDTSLTWTESFVRLDRFSIPRILHAQTYILSVLHAGITVYILMFSAWAHFDALNPLAPDVPGMIHIPERGRPRKTWSVTTSVVWWLWVAGVFGWAGEVLRAWHHRGPHPSLPLSPSTLLPLLHHGLVLAALLLRISALLWKRPPAFLFASSLSLLAWSIPFLAASRVLPQNLPMFGTPTHMRWEKIRDGRRRRDVGYRPPPKNVPVSHRALRSLEAHLGGLVQFGSYFAIFGILLLWSLSGELDYPGLFLAPNYFVQATASFLTSPKSRPVSPIEARTTLAFTLVLGLVMAYFAGGRPSTSGKSPYAHHKELDDLDGWDRYGKEVAFRSRRERLAVNRYYTFVPPLLHHHSLESVPSAFGTPPLPSPLNLIVLPLSLTASVVKRWFGRDDWARRIHERGKLWIWRFGVAPLGVWAVFAKGIRSLRGTE